MPEAIKVVAILANPALSSILNAVLAATYGLRVRSFESALALTTYMRLSPVDLLVCDFDCEASPAGSLARALRGDPTVTDRHFQIIALASAVDDELKAASIASGIDEVIVKPMSPKYLLERVVSRLKRGGLKIAESKHVGSPERRRPSLPRSNPPRGGHTGYRDNVVPLFKDQPLPLT